MSKENPQSTPEENFDRLLNMPLRVSVELGNTRLRVQELLDLSQGSVVDLERLAGEPVDVLVNGRPFGTGEIVISHERYAVRMLTIRSRSERVESLA